MALNLSVVPFAPYPGLPPEAAVRAGMGGWEPYALAAPADRLLPFVFTRPALPGGPAWVNCAWVEHADTGARVATLLPTGATAGPPPPDALVLQKLPESARGVEHFVYAGALVPGLDLPCGVPLRLVLDNAWQSPRFLAYGELSGFLRLDWWHPGPLGGLPYGTGLRQRLYVAGAALAYGKAREEREVTKIAATGDERIDFLALYRVAALAIEPVPPYLSEALDGAPAHALAEVDGEPWRIKASKDKTQGEQGGRASMELTLEQETVVVRRAAPEPALAPVAFDPVADAPRAWRCGDESDMAPDWQTTGYACALDADGRNTGYVQQQQRDVNPNSPGYNATRSLTSAAPDPTRCPLPTRYLSVALYGSAQKNDCAAGYEAAEDVPYSLPVGAFSSYDSQAAADALAQAAFATQAQAHANAVGTCQPAVQWQPVYDGNGCFDCLMANVNDPGQVRPATAAEAADWYRRFGSDPATGAKVSCSTCS